MNWKLNEMKGLLIEFELCSGKRAGNINPKDQYLKCYGWQDLENEPAKEIRIIEDDRKLNQYKNITGVTILYTNTEIENAIIEYIPKKYAIEDAIIFQMDYMNKKIKLDNSSHISSDKILEKLYKKGVQGIKEIKPMSLKNVYDNEL